jgi:hypothetical protein
MLPIASLVNLVNGREKTFLICRGRRFKPKNIETNYAMKRLGYWNRVKFGELSNTSKLRLHALAVCRLLSGFLVDFLFLKRLSQKYDYLGACHSSVK